MLTKNNSHYFILVISLRPQAETLVLGILPTIEQHLGLYILFCDANIGSAWPNRSFSRQRRPLRCLAKSPNPHMRIGWLVNENHFERAMHSAYIVSRLTAWFISGAIQNAERTWIWNSD
jgi:hypothetical protein